jgi:hypothetical protein
MKKDMKNMKNINTNCPLNVIYLLFVVYLIALFHFLIICSIEWKNHIFMMNWKDMEGSGRSLI